MFWNLKKEDLIKSGTSNAIRKLFLCVAGMGALAASGFIFDYFLVSIFFPSATFRYGDGGITFHALMPFVPQLGRCVVNILIGVKCIQCIKMNDPKYSIQKRKRSIGLLIFLLFLTLVTFFLKFAAFTVHSKFLHLSMLDSAVYFLSHVVQVLSGFFACMTIVVWGSYWLRAISCTMKQRLAIPRLLAAAFVAVFAIGGMLFSSLFDIRAAENMFAGNLFGLTHFSILSMLIVPIVISYIFSAFYYRYHNFFSPMLLTFLICAVEYIFGGELTAGNGAFALCLVSLGCSIPFLIASYLINSKAVKVGKFAGDDLCYPNDGEKNEK